MSPMASRDPYRRTVWFDPALGLELDTTLMGGEEAAPSGMPERLGAAPEAIGIADGAVTSDKWELATPWFEWSFDAPAVPPASSPLP